MTVCAQCRARRRVTVEMEPGHDGDRWYLCARCYVDGLRLKPPATAEPSRSVAKDDVGDFDRVPPKRSRKWRP